MSSGSRALRDLVQLLSRLPTIGERTATRLSHAILSGPPEYAEALGRSLSELHQRVKRCVRCGNFGDTALCALCSDERRNSHQLCVVARVPDLEAIERSASYRGRYHVLHALLAPLEGLGPEQVPLDALRQRVIEEGVKELILATPWTVEGEATALYISESLQDTGVQISRIASGVPHGGELEYTDQVTLGRALAGRQSVG